METKTITPAVIAAAAGLLQPFAPELTPTGLVAAIREYTPGKKPKNDDRPLTRREAAELLQCSLNTVTKYMKSGKLRKITLTARSCRIDAASVKKLLSAEPENAE